MIMDKKFVKVFKWCNQHCINNNLFIFVRIYIIIKKSAYLVY